MTNSKVVFIGGGQMAQALAGGALQAGVLAEQELVFAEPNADQQQVLRNKYAGCQVVAQAADAFHEGRYIVLAVKPNVLRAVAADVASGITPEHLLVSIAAGVSLPALQAMFATQRIIRVMPNTPAQIGVGAAAIAADETALAADVQWVERLLGAVGTTVRVPDALMHAVTGLSGSGPAYIYMAIEALSDGGVASGLPRAVATQLAAQTVLGAAQMVLTSGQHPGALKDQVTSPGGTTIAAVRALEAAGLRSALIEAVVRATQRSTELG
ncbi:MAG: pyrroline-5-carboxylate reductase [Planctomycetales bacterium]|nr:pyrroline-5-carboxylate reductase [Planctomycetales bacterium]